jgi:hypothetical protein
MKDSAQDSLRDSSAPPSRGTHTPTPWHIVSDGETAELIVRAPSREICHIQCASDENSPINALHAANAVFIVKAVNSHDGLVAALERALPLLEKHAHQFNHEHRACEIIRGVLVKVQS